ncbi:MAG: MgtC/SapB family protein [Planctomycetota bacterium]
MDWLDLLKLLGAIAAGGLIGLERELRDKPAGFRTNILICLGAALFTLLSVKLAEGRGLVDPTRIAAQIVTGVGFLGAGAIIQRRSHVRGLTTAATIWAVASVGMAFGAGAFALGILGALLTTGVVFGLSYAEYQISRWRSRAVYEVLLAPTAEAEARVQQIVTESGVRVRSWQLTKRAANIVGRLVAVGPGSALDHLGARLAHEETVRAVRRL